MTRFIAGRLVQMVFIVWVALTILFFFVRFSGDPALVIAGPTATPENLEAMRETMGLNDPLIVQYGTFLKDVVQLDFGTSYITGEAALGAMVSSLPASLKIAIPALLVSVVLAVAVGTYAALHNGDKRGRIVMLIAWLGDATPFFVIAYVSVLLLAINRGWFPASGGEGVSSLVLPVTAIVIPQVATLSRLVRGQLLDVLSQPYVVALRSTGVSKWRVLLQAAPNAIPPIVSFVGVMMGFFLTMLVVVEPIFNYPGFGGILIRSVTGRDFPIVQAAVFIIAIVVIGANLLADTINRLIDPQLRRAQ